MSLPPPTSTASAAALRDHDVAALVQRGELHRAFELVAERYEAKVYRLCVALLRDPNRAQDAAQESLLRVWKALQSFDGRAALSTWIYTITRNRCLTALEQRRDELSIGDAAVLAEAEAVLAHDERAAHEQAQAIRRLVDELPEAARRVVTLFYFEERSVAEVASMLGQTQGNVKTQLFRARAALLARLAALGLGSPDAWVV
jgi:RNA polymerase sigma-70 factor, ECF subfamily